MSGVHLSEDGCFIMSKRYHDELVAVVRGVHEQLRLDYQTKGNHDEVWANHCSDSEVRQRYAESMKTLATTIWQYDDRIEWCNVTIRDYFYNGGLQKAISRQCRKRGNECLEKCLNAALQELKLDITKPVILDVGSCYNPFKVYEDLDTVAIDLTPASEDVLQCDFLQLSVVPSPTPNTTDVSNLTSPLVQLPAEYFHAVLFILVLEYLPSTVQRWTFCCKAAQLLKNNGLLLIVTPDSKHQQKNAAMIRSWKDALETIGLLRICYEKRQHLHCMAFRKDSDHERCTNDADVLKMIYIPQDSRDYVELLKRAIIEQRTDDDDAVLRDSFNELPECPDDL